MILLAAGALLLLPDPAVQAGSGLRAALDAVLAPAEAEGDIRIGVSVEDIRGDRLYGHREEEARVLASNTKLFTTAAALLALPPGYRWHTRAWLHGRVLRLRGGWDPSLRESLHGDGGEILLDNLVLALRERGTRSLDAVVIEEPAGASPARHPLWPEAQWPQPYAAGLAALSVEGGCLRVTVGAAGRIRLAPALRPPVQVQRRDAAERGLLRLDWLVPDERLRVTRGPGPEREALVATRDPRAVARRWLREGLAARGLAVAAIETRETADGGGDGELVLDLASLWSLGEAVAVANKRSDNFTTEMILRTLAAESGRTPDFAGGVAAALDVLAAEGVPTRDVRLADGSGLARGGTDRVNVAPPAVVCALLRTMAERREGRILFDSLLVGGQDGRLAERFTDPLFQPGRVHAKTGWIRGASTLSGYLLAGERRILAFSILVNYEWDGTPRTNNRRFKALQERLLGELLRRLPAAGREQR